MRYGVIQAHHTSHNWILHTEIANNTKQSNNFRAYANAILLKLRRRCGVPSGDWIARFKPDFSANFDTDEVVACGEARCTSASVLLHQDGGFKKRRYSVSAKLAPSACSACAVDSRFVLVLCVCECVAEYVGIFVWCETSVGWCRKREKW